MHDGAFSKDLPRHRCVHTLEKQLLQTLHAGTRSRGRVSTSGHSSLAFAWLVPHERHLTPVAPSVVDAKGGVGSCKV
eukprot:scaffold431_cov334-Pavlova_lutheri.AAC.92